MAAITLVYAIVAFSRLGDRFGPFTYARLNDREEFTVELDTPSVITRVQLLPGPTRLSGCEFYYSADGENWDGPFSKSIDGAFKWDEFENTFNEKPYKYVKLKNYSEGLEGSVNFTTLAEVAFRNETDEVIKIKSFPAEYGAFFDEQDVIPKVMNYYNSSIFDEIYYNQTIANLLRGEDIFETTHPHLGKYLMVLGVKIFGFNPFGWRFIGTLFGVLMLPVAYVFARRMFGSAFYASFATITFAFDFMHFSQTRLATIDTYPTFFIMLMFYFMYRYYRMNFLEVPLKKTLLPLFLSGLFMGLGFASKWPTAYGGIGLAIIFFYALYKRYAEAKTFGRMEEFIEKAVTTCALCVVFFVIIPAAIYVASYIPQYNIESEKLRFINQEYGTAYGSTQSALAEVKDPGVVKFVLYTQRNMFNFHSKLNDTHPYSAFWWEWLIDLRPILYHIPPKDLGDKTEAVSAFGNPAVWWIGLAAVFYCVSTVNKGDKNSLFLLIAYFSQLAPWALVTTRTTFVYHYFPCVIFLVLATTSMFKNAVKNKKFAVAYLGVVIILFAMFYPVLSALTVPKSYINTFLRWFPTWWLA
jgi:dolichyl-phosphate-mannose--protein O-mannosyl transferase